LSHGGEGPAAATFGLTRDYGGIGLFDVDLSVARGCVYGLVGPNGAGKTTMLSIITGMRHADRGTAFGHAKPEGRARQSGLACSR
jgi:ABC-2 type transport system ATP-binding protein